MSDQANHDLAPQLFCGAAPLTAERLQPLRLQRGPQHKPSGGIWTSTWEAATHTSGWVDWARAEDWENRLGAVWSLATPYPTAQIYTIDTLADLRRAVMQFPYFLPDMASDALQINFVAMSQYYDGIHLTEAGQQATRCPEIPTPNLYVWDCECTLWFRWQFATVTVIRP